MGVAQLALQTGAKELFCYPHLGTQLASRNAKHEIKENLINLLLDIFNIIKYNNSPVESFFSQEWSKNKEKLQRAIKLINQNEEGEDIQ